MCACVCVCHFVLLVVITLYYYASCTSPVSGYTEVGAGDTTQIQSHTLSQASVVVFTLWWFVLSLLINY